MKNIIYIVIALFFVSCAPQGQKDIEAEISEYRQLVEEYNQKIRELEQEKNQQQLAAGEAPRESRQVVVEVKKMSPEPFSSYFEATGTVEAVEDAFISPEVNGQVSAIPVNRGDRVKKGDLLIRLKTDVTQSNIDEVKTSLALAVKLFEKQQQLWEKEIGSELQYLEAKNNKESLEARLATLESQLEMAFIRAPFSGVVDDIMVKTGELASPGMRLLRLVNLDEIRISAEVSESFMGKVREGEMAQLRFASLPELQLERPVHRTGMVIDPVTRTFTVEVLVDNKDQLLKPNMLSSLRIRDFSDEDALVVPSIILKEDFNGTFLFRVSDEAGGPKAEKIYVETGRTVQDLTMITEGIRAGDQVIVSGYNLVSDEVPVRIIE
jgi:RND family efflux transporter MFP subunit